MSRHPVWKRLNKWSRSWHRWGAILASVPVLVIIATAYISRTQGGCVIAAAQRKAIDREEESALIQTVRGSGYRIAAEEGAA